MGTLPGRKTLVYFSEGLPLTAVGKLQLQATINAANRSNVGIYVIDVAGLSMATRTEAGRQMLAAAAQAGANNTGPPTGGSTAGLGIPQGRAAVSTVPQGTVTSDQVKAGDRAEDIAASDSQASLIQLAK